MAQDFIPSPLISISDETQGRPVSISTTNPFKIESSSTAIRPYQFTPSDLQEFYANSLWFDGVKFSIPMIINIFNSASMGNSVDQARLFSLMMSRDMVLAAHIGTRINAVLGCEWDILADEDDPAGPAKAKQIKKMFDQAGVRSLMRHLLSAIPFGYAGANPIYDGKRGTTLEEFNLIHPAAFYFDVAGNWELRGFSNMKPSLFSHKTKTGFIFHSYQAMPGTPQTGGLLRTCALNYLFKHELAKHHIHFLEKYGIVPLIGKICNEDFNDAERRQTILMSLAMIGANGAAVVNKETDITPLAVPANGSNGDFEKAVNALNDEYAMFILGQKASMSTAGGMSNGQVQNLVRLDILKADCLSLTETMNAQVLAPLEFFKWGTSSCRFTINFNPSENVKDQAAIVAQLASVGYKVDRRWVEDNLKIKLEKELPAVQAGNSLPSLPAMGGAGTTSPLSLPGGSPELPQASAPLSQPEASQTIEPMSDLPVKGSQRYIKFDDWQSLVPQSLGAVSREDAIYKVFKQINAPDITEEDRISWQEILQKLNESDSDTQLISGAAEPIYQQENAISGPDIQQATPPIDNLMQEPSGFETEQAIEENVNQPVSAPIDSSAIKSAMNRFTIAFNEAVLASNSGTAKERNEYGSDAYYGEWFDRIVSRFSPDEINMLGGLNSPWMAESKAQFITDAKAARNMTQSELVDRVPSSLVVPDSERYALTHGFFSNMGVAAYRGVENMGLHIDTALNAITGDIAGAGDYLEKVQKYNSLESVADAIKTDNKIANVAYFLAEMTPVMAAGIGLSVATGGVAAPVLFGLDAMGASYNDMRISGVDSRLALAGSLGVGVLGGALGGARLGNMVPAVMKKSFESFGSAFTQSVGTALSDRLKQATSRYGEEAVTGALKKAGEAISKGYDFAMRPSAMAVDAITDNASRGFFTGMATGTIDAVSNTILQGIGTTVIQDVSKIASDKLTGSGISRDNPNLASQLSDMANNWSEQLVPIMAMSVIGHSVNPLIAKSMRSQAEKEAAKAPSIESMDAARKIAPVDIASSMKEADVNTGLIAPLAKILDSNLQLRNGLNSGKVDIKFETLDSDVGAKIVEQNGKTTIIVDKSGLKKKLADVSSPTAMASIVTDSFNSLFTHEAFSHWFIYSLEGASKEAKSALEKAALSDASSMSAAERHQNYDKYLVDAGIQEEAKRRQIINGIENGKSIESMLEGKTLGGQKLTASLLRDRIAQEAVSNFVSQNIGRVEPTSRIGQIFNNMISFVELNMADILEKTAKYIAPDAANLSVEALRRQAAMRLISGALGKYKKGTANISRMSGQLPSDTRYSLNRPEDAGRINAVINESSIAPYLKESIAGRILKLEPYEVQNREMLEQDLAQAGLSVDSVREKAGLTPLPKSPITPKEDMDYTNAVQTNQIDKAKAIRDAVSKRLGVDLGSGDIQRYPDGRSIPLAKAYQDTKSSDVRYSLKTPLQQIREAAYEAGKAKDDARYNALMYADQVSEGNPDLARRVIDGLDRIRITKEKDGVEKYNEKVKKFMTETVPDWEAKELEAMKTQTNKAEAQEYRKSADAVQSLFELPFAPYDANTLIPDGALKTSIGDQIVKAYGLITSPEELYNLGWHTQQGESARPGKDFSNLSQADKDSWISAYDVIMRVQDKSTIADYTQELMTAFKDKNIVKAITDIVKDRMGSAKINAYRRAIIIDRINRLNEKNDIYAIQELTKDALTMADETEAKNALKAAMTLAGSELGRLRNFIHQRDATQAGAIPSGRVDADGKVIITDASEIRKSIANVFMNDAERNKGLSETLPFMSGKLAIDLINHEWARYGFKNAREYFLSFSDSLSNEYKASHGIDSDAVKIEFNKLENSPSNDISKNLIAMLGGNDIIGYQATPEMIAGRINANPDIKDRATIQSNVEFYQNRMDRIQQQSAVINKLIDQRNLLPAGSTEDIGAINDKISDAIASLEELQNPKILSRMSTQELMDFYNDMKFRRLIQKSYGEAVKQMKAEVVQRDQAISETEISNAVKSEDGLGNLSESQKAAVKRSGDEAMLKQFSNLMNVKGFATGMMQPALVIRIITGFKDNSVMWQNTMKKVLASIPKGKTCNNDMTHAAAKIAIDCKINGIKAAKKEAPIKFALNGENYEFSIPVAMEIQAHSKNIRSRRHLLGTQGIGSPDVINAVVDGLSKVGDGRYSRFVDRVMAEVVPIAYKHMNGAFSQLHGINLAQDDGYWPIRNLMRDSSLMPVTDDMMLSGAGARRPSIQVAGIKERTDSSAPFDLAKMDFFSTFGALVRDTTRYSSMAPVVHDINAFLSPLIPKISEKSPFLASTLKNWVYDLAYPPRNDATETQLRQYAALSILAVRPTSIIMQAGSLTTGLIGIQKDGWMSCMTELVSKSPLKFISDVNDKSSFMKHRPSYDIDTYTDAMFDFDYANNAVRNDFISWMKALNPIVFKAGGGKALDPWRTAKMVARASMKPMAVLDQFYAQFVWKCRYLDYLSRKDANGNPLYSDETAISMADDVISKSQSIADSRVVPEYMRRPGWARTLSMFYGPALQANNVVWENLLKSSGAIKGNTEAQKLLAIQEGGKYWALARVGFALSGAVLLNALLTYGPSFNSLDAENAIYETANLGIGGMPVVSSIALCSADILRASMRKSKGEGGEPYKSLRQGGLNLPWYDILQDNFTDATLALSGQMTGTEWSKRMLARNLSGPSFLWNIGDRVKTAEKYDNSWLYLVYSSGRMQEKRYHPAGLALTSNFTDLDKLLVNYNYTHPDDAYYASRNSMVWKFDRYQITLTEDEYEDYNDAVTLYFESDPSIRNIRLKPGLSPHDVSLIEKAMSDARGKAKNSMRRAIVLNHTNDIRIPGVSGPPSFRDIMSIAATGRMAQREDEYLATTDLDIRLIETSLILADDSSEPASVSDDIRQKAITAVRLDQQMDMIKAQLDVLKTTLAPYVQKASIVTGIGKTLSWNPESDRKTLNREKLAQAIMARFKLNSTAASQVVDEGSNITLTKGHVKIVESKKPSIPHATRAQSPKMQEPATVSNAQEDKKSPAPIAPSPVIAKATVEPPKPIDNSSTGAIGESALPQQAKSPSEGLSENSTITAEA